MDHSRSFTLRAGLALADLDLKAFWTLYRRRGGRAPFLALHFALASGAPLPDADHDLAAGILNEVLVREGFGSPVAYSGDLAASDRPGDAGG